MASIKWKAKVNNGVLVFGQKMHGNTHKLYIQYELIFWPVCQSRTVWATAQGLQRVHNKSRPESSRSLVLLMCSCYFRSKTSVLAVQQMWTYTFTRLTLLSLHTLVYAAGLLHGITYAGGWERKHTDSLQVITVFNFQRKHLSKKHCRWKCRKSTTKFEQKKKPSLGI